MGRNRNQRRLEAKLDNQTKNLNSPKPDSIPVYCEYKSICPPNIKKYSMKCIFGKKDCKIRKYFKRFDKLDLMNLGVGS